MDFRRLQVDVSILLAVTNLQLLVYATMQWSLDEELYYYY